MSALPLPPKLQTAYAKDPRTAYAQALMQNQTEPLTGYSGMVNVLQSALGGYAQRKTGQDFQGQTQQYNKALADALAAYGAGDVQGAMKAASQSPYLQDLGTSIAGENMKNQRAQQRLQMEATARAAQSQDERAWRAQEAETERAWRAQQEEARRKFEAEQNAARLAAQQVGGGAPDPYFQFLPGADGYLVGNARTGQIEPGMVNGQRAVPGALSPPLQGELAAAKESGKVTGKDAAQSVIDLPGYIANTDQTIGVVRQILEHPGLSGAVGAKNWSSGFGVLNSPISGTKEADFTALRDQLLGKQFLAAFESLKGGGQITEVEGRKATDAIAAMQTSQSEEAFRKSAQDFIEVLEAGKARALRKAQGLGAGASGAFDAPAGGWQDMGNGVRVRVKQ